MSNFHTINRTKDYTNEHRQTIDPQEKGKMNADKLLTAEQLAGAIKMAGEGIKKELA